MLSKFFTAPIFLLVLTSSVNAGAAFGPALGVPGNGTPGKPEQGDVQKPSTSDQCGNVDIPNNLGNSTAVTADTEGGFQPYFINFPTDKSTRTIQTAKIDTSASGSSFVTAPNMVVSGNSAPPDSAQQQLTCKLPTGTKCVGGPDKNICIVSFTADDGTGNCILVKQPATATDKAASPENTSPTNPTSPQTIANEKSGNGLSEAGNVHKRRMVRRVARRV